MYPGVWGENVNDAGETVDKSKVGDYISKVKTGTEETDIDTNIFGSGVSASVVKNELTSITNISGQHTTTGYAKFGEINIQANGSNLASEAVATVTILQAIKRGTGYDTSANVNAFIDTLYTLIKATVIIQSNAETSTRSSGTGHKGTYTRPKHCYDTGDDGVDKPFLEDRHITG